MALRLFQNPDEKPLDRFPVVNGGMIAIFRTIACIGDSLSSGEFESVSSDGQKSYHDMFEYSWGQFIARTIGAKVYNFSRGGMSAKEYVESYADLKGFWDPEKAVQAYFIALGINDLMGCKMEPGSADDVNIEKPEESKNTFAGWFGRIILRYHQISPKAKFFLITMPSSKDSSWANEEEAAVCQRRIMYEMAQKFDNCYVLDLYEHGPIYDDAFRKDYFLLGHLNPAGYCLTAQMYMTYVDYLVRHNASDFKQVGLINTPWYMEHYKH